MRTLIPKHSHCILVDREEISALSNQIVEQFHPERVILFGSYANGNPTEDSDVDLMVILPVEGLPVNKAAEIRSRVRPSFPLDLMVRTPEGIRERLALGDDFIRDILERGEVLYEGTHG